MRIEIYRKRQVLGFSITDDEPEKVYENVKNVELRSSVLLGDVNGEQLTLDLDWWNYDYHIL